MTTSGRHRGSSNTDPKTQKSVALTAFSSESEPTAPRRLQPRGGRRCGHKPRQRLLADKLRNLSNFSLSLTSPAVSRGSDAKTDRGTITYRLPKTAGHPAPPQTGSPPHCRTYGIGEDQEREQRSFCGQVPKKQSAQPD